MTHTMNNDKQCYNGMGWTEIDLNIILNIARDNVARSCEDIATQYDNINITNGHKEMIDELPYLPCLYDQMMIFMILLTSIHSSVCVYICV